MIARCIPSAKGVSRIRRIALLHARPLSNRSSDSNTPQQDADVKQTAQSPTEDTQSPHASPFGQDIESYMTGLMDLERFSTSTSLPVELTPDHGEGSLHIPPEEHEPFFPDSPPHVDVPVAQYRRTVTGIYEVSQALSGKDLRPPTEQRPIAKLAHGLDRVLFNPGVHWLQDPRSRVYNFTPWLQRVPQLSTFDSDRVTGFVKSSRDEDLWTAASQANCQFAGSTSSLTGMLCQIYFLLSRQSSVNLERLSRAFAKSDNSFTPGQQLPVSVVLNYKEGVYLTDSDPVDPGQMGASVLSFMGTMLEKFLTVPKAEFQTFLHDSPYEPGPDSRREAYRYAKFGSYAMRSQLDCHDDRLPGTGIFDIKTRAAIPLRLDPMNIEEGSGYLLRTLFGRLESFESEYYDLIRSAFLKYSFQARIGNMDGVLVTYHNTSQIFGFQYVPLNDMDFALYGNEAAGPDVFAACVGMLEAVTKEIITHFPQQSVSCLWKTPPGGRVMHVFVEPTDWLPSFDGEEKPVVQINVAVENLIDGGLERGSVLHQLGGVKGWTIEYAIRIIDESFASIRERKQLFLDMQRRFWALPTGMTLEQMEQFWKSGLGIGRVPEAEFNPGRFTDATGFLQVLRSMSRLGTYDTNRKMKEEGGKKKVMWRQTDGELEDWEEDVIQEGLGVSHSGDSKSDRAEDALGPVLPVTLRLMSDEPLLARVGRNNSSNSKLSGGDAPNPKPQRKTIEPLSVRLARLRCSGDATSSPKSRDAESSAKGVPSSKRSRLSRAKLASGTTALKKTMASNLQKRIDSRSAPVLSSKPQGLPPIVQERQKNIPSYLVDGLIRRPADKRNPAVPAKSR